MLKNIFRLFFKNSSMEEDVRAYDEINKFKVYQKKSHDRANELKLTGNQYFNEQNLIQAEIYFKQSLELDLTQYEVYKNLGVVYYYQRKLEEALKCYDQALALKPDYPEALNNKGLVLKDMNRHEDALVNLDRAIALKSGFAFAHRNRGLVLMELERLDEALKSYGYAVEFLPNHELFYGYWVEIKTMLCDWKDYEVDLRCIEEHVANGGNPIAPLVLLTLSNAPELQKKVAENIMHAKLPQSDALPPLTKYPRRNKIRVGYFSADFRNHAVSFLTAELFETHDKSRFELIAFSFSSIKDAMTKRLELAFDRFIDVSKLSDQEVAVMARELEIDIAIDLVGATGGARTAIFAMRAAPAQVSYLGYPGTMGADYIDYIIADTTIIPPTHQQYYSEKVAYLPSFQVNDTKREISDRVFTREQLGLPPTGFVFCCFNNVTKIGPINYDSWMRILKQVEGSVLWLLDESPAAVSNLRKEAIARGVDSNRIVFAKRESLPDYLARYRMADLFLDTLPYNAGTTASDALWAGLPVLTQIGEAFAGRMAASLLNAIHLPELITTTQEEYQALAIELAMKPDKLARIKQKLSENRLTTPLFDIEYFTKHLESAYTQMYERCQAGLAPEHIVTA